MHAPMYGPDRVSDAYPLTPSADVRAIRQRAELPPYAGPDEAYDSHLEYLAGLELEQWGGENPWLEMER